MAASTCVGGFRRDNRDQLSFVRDIERIEPQKFTGAAHFFAHWNAFSSISMLTPRLRGDFVQSAGEAAARGVAQARKLRGYRQHVRHQLGAAERNRSRWSVSNSRPSRLAMMAVP